MDALLGRHDPHHPPAAALVHALGRPVPECWRLLAVEPGFDTDRMQSSPPLFLHERTTRSGLRRIVLIGLAHGPNADGQYLPCGFEVTLASPATPNRAAAVIGEPRRFDERPAVSHVIQFFAGQPDAADPTHFTMDYEYDDRRGSIDGWLADDGNSVKFHGWPTDAPAQKPDGE